MTAHSAIEAAARLRDRAIVLACCVGIVLAMVMR